MNRDLTFSDQKIMLRLLEVSGEVCFIKSDMAGKFKYINEAGSKLFGIKDSNFEIKDLFADPDDWEDLKYKLKTQHFFQDLTFLLKSTSNKNYWTKVSIEITEETYIYWVLKDITSEQEYQQEVRHQRALLEKSRNEMDRIIYSASHDLRSPISSVLGLLNLLSLAHTDQERNEYMFMMQSSVMKLDLLVQNLGRLSKNSNESVKDEKIHFESMLDEIMTELSFHPNFQKIKLQKSLSEKQVFYSDFERIKLVLSNVLKNCLDYFDVNKSQNFADIELICTADKAAIKIFDNGIGISKSNINRVFDLFYRGSDRSKGTGLGLFESREIIVKLGGKIKLHSEYTVGTSIEIEIPNSKKGKLINKKNKLIS